MAWVIAAFATVLVTLAGYELHLRARRSELRKELGEEDPEA